MSETVEIYGRTLKLELAESPEQKRRMLIRLLYNAHSVLIL